MDCTRSPRAELIHSGGPGPRFSSYVLLAAPSTLSLRPTQGPQGIPLSVRSKEQPGLGFELLPSTQEAWLERETQKTHL